jgi:hypothetical protein
MVIIAGMEINTCNLHAPHNVQPWLQNGAFATLGGLVMKTTIIIIGLPRAQDVRLVRQLQCVTAFHAQDVTLVSNPNPATVCQGKFKYQRFNKNRRPGRGRNMFRVI